MEQSRPTTREIARAGFPGKSLSAVELARLQQTMRRVAYRRGEPIFRQGDTPDGIHCIASGQVLLERVDHGGNQIAFFIAAGGDLVGYRSLFAGQPHSATARTLSRCHTLFVPSAPLYQLIEENSELAREVLKLLARDPGPIAAPLLRNPYVPAGSRLSHLLLELGERFGSHLPGDRLTFALPITRTDIAALIGVRRETVARLLQELERARILRLKARTVFVDDPKRLATLATSASDPAS